MKIYTIKDIARLAGVSVTTVSRVLNDRPDVNPETRQKVRQIIDQYQFRGNDHARGLKQGAEVIGLVVRGRSNPFLSSLTEAILSLSDALPDRLVTEYIDEQGNEFQAAPRMIHQSHVRGIIFVGSLIDHRAAVLDGMDLPLVFTTVSVGQLHLARASSVSVNDLALGRLVGEKLLSMGHRRILVYGSNPVAGDSLARRFEGFCESFLARGLSFDQTCYYESRFSFEDGYETVMRSFRDHPDATAVFAMCDTLAIGAIRALRDLHLSVPGDVSVIGFDGIDLGQFTVPRLTTVEQPVTEIARCSIQLMNDLLTGNAEPRQIILDASIIHRESLRALE